MQPPFEAPRYLRQREAERKIKGGHGEIDGEGTEGDGGGELALAGQLDEADDGGERRILDELHQEPDGGRNAQSDGLRDDDVPQLRADTETERGAGLPLGLRDGLQAAAPDFAQEGAGVDRIGRRRGDPGRNFDAHDRQAEEEDEQPCEQRRALYDMNVEGPRSEERRVGKE